jgi:hypothetical protein
VICFSDINWQIALQCEFTDTGDNVMKLLSKFFVVMILVLLSSVTVALAPKNSDSQDQRIMMRGHVTEIGEDCLTLSLSSGESVTITVNDQTRIDLSRKQTEGHLSDIRVGNRVSIQGRQTDENSVVARVILVVPSQLRSRVRIRGQVTVINNSSFILHSQRGDYTVFTDDSTQYQTQGRHIEANNGLEVGSTILVRGTQVQDQKNTIQAKSIRYPGQRSK